MGQQQTGPRADPAGGGPGEHGPPSPLATCSRADVPTLYRNRTDASTRGRGWPPLRETDVPRGQAAQHTVSAYNGTLSQGGVLTPQGADCLGCEPHQGWWLRSCRGSLCHVPGVKSASDDDPALKERTWDRLSRRNKRRTLQQCSHEHLSDCREWGPPMQPERGPEEHGSARSRSPSSAFISDLRREGPQPRCGCTALDTPSRGRRRPSETP